MGRSAVVTEVLAIVSGACLGAMMLPTTLMPGCGLPRGATYLPALVDEPQTSTIRFESFEPSDQVVVVGRGRSRQRLEPGLEIRVNGTDLNVQLRTLDRAGPVKVAFEVLHDEVSVGRSEIIGLRPRLLLSAGVLRVQEWSSGRPQLPSRRLSLEYQVRSGTRGVLGQAPGLLDRVQDYFARFIEPPSARQQMVGLESRGSA